jgi:hypothetical protein
MATRRTSSGSGPATGTMAGTLMHSTTPAGLNPAGIGSPGKPAGGLIVPSKAGHFTRLAAASTPARPGVLLAAELCPELAAAAA